MQRRGETDIGRAVCCNGVAIVCMFKPETPETQQPIFPQHSDPKFRDGAAEARRLVNNCLIRHELRHITQGPCGGGFFDPTDPNALELFRCEHCAIYRRDGECLQRALEKCAELTGDNRFACESHIQTEIILNNNFIAENCGGYEEILPE